MMEMEQQLISMGRSTSINFAPNLAHDKPKSSYEKLRNLPFAVEVGSLLPAIRVVFVLQFWNKLLGICVVTWACVVVLGGFLSTIPRPEFMRVSFLLLMHSLFLFYNTSWPYYVVQLGDAALYFGGQQIRTPSVLVGKSQRERFCHTYARGEISAFFFAFAFSTSFVCMVFSTAVALTQSLERNLFASSNDAALKIFYDLVVINSLVADLQMMFLLRAFITSDLEKGRSICALSYFFRAVLASASRDYFRSRELDLLNFVFDMMSDECEDSIERIDELHSLCLDMVPYVYHHPRGFEATLAAMESDNYYKQEAAVLMVGFLVHQESCMPTSRDEAPRLLIRSQTAIVEKLIELAGLGKDRGTVKGPRKDAALWSLLKLAQHDVQPLQEIEQLSKIPQNLEELEAAQAQQHGSASQDSTIEEDRCDELLPLLNILNAIQEGEDGGFYVGRPLSDQLMRKVEGIARAEARAPLLQAAAQLILKLLKEVRAPPSKQPPPTLWQRLLRAPANKPQPQAIKVGGCVLVVLYIVTLGLGAVLGSACYVGYSTIIKDRTPPPTPSPSPF